MKKKDIIHNLGIAIYKCFEDEEKWVLDPNWIECFVTKASKRTYEVAKECLCDREKK